MSTELVRITAPSLTERHANHGFRYVALWRHGETSLRVSLEVDHSYPWQSRYVVEFLTQDGWKELHRLAPSESASQQRSTTRGFPTNAIRTAVNQDEQALLAIAIPLLTTLKETTHAE